MHNHIDEPQTTTVIPNDYFDQSRHPSGRKSQINNKKIIFNHSHIRNSSIHSQMKPNNKSNEWNAYINQVLINNNYYLQIIPLLLI